MVINDIVGGTVGEFVSYAMAVVAIMVIYYIIKFFMVQPPTKEEREEAEREQKKAWTEAFGKLKQKTEEREKKIKTEKEKKRRRKMIKGAESFLIDSLKEVEKSIGEIGTATAASLGNAAASIGNAAREGRKAWKELQKVTQKLTGEEREEFFNLAVAAQANWVQARDLVKVIISEKKKRPADRTLPALADRLNNLRDELAALLNKIK